jgi:hypothetical protein
MIPEVAYYARRGFAGGAYEHYNYASPLNQQRVVERLGRQQVPFAVIPSESAQELDEDLTTVLGYFKGRYSLLTDIPCTRISSVRILVDNSLPSRSRDAETGWPCFR